MREEKSNFARFFLASPWAFRVKGWRAEIDRPGGGIRIVQYQHSLLISDLTGTTYNGVNYYVFELDSNQSGGAFAHEITMTKLQIFTSSDPNQTVTTFDSNGILQLSGTLVYNLGNNQVKATANGSGKSDFFMYIPTSILQTGEQYLYLYCAFSGADGVHGGFEEWNFQSGTLVPEMGTFFPVIGLLVAVLSTHVLRRRKIAQLARQQSILD